MMKSQVVDVLSMLPRSTLQIRSENDSHRMMMLNGLLLVIAIGCWSLKGDVFNSDLQIECSRQQENQLNGLSASNCCNANLALPTFEAHLCNFIRFDWALLALKFFFTSFLPDCSRLSFFGLVLLVVFVLIYLRLKCRVRVVLAFFCLGQ